MTLSAQFEPTIDDLVAFNTYHHAHSSYLRLRYYRNLILPNLIWVLVCAAIWVTADREPGETIPVLVSMIPLFAFFPIYTIYYLTSYERRIRKMVERMASEGQNRGLFTPRSVTISPECVTDTSNSKTTRPPGGQSNAWPATTSTFSSTRAP
jgi:hypothetical protein